jgi:hypothetical protein
MVAGLLTWLLQQPPLAWREQQHSIIDQEFLAVILSPARVEEAAGVPSLLSSPSTIDIVDTVDTLPAYWLIIGENMACLYTRVRT